MESKHWSRHARQHIDEDFDSAGSKVETFFTQNTQMKEDGIIGCKKGRANSTAYYRSEMIEND